MRNECRQSEDRAERRSNTEASDEKKKSVDSVDSEFEKKTIAVAWVTAPSAARGVPSEERR